MKTYWKKGPVRKNLGKKKFMFLVSNKDGCFEIITLCNNLRVSCGFFYLEIKQMYNVEWNNSENRYTILVAYSSSFQMRKLTRLHVSLPN